MEEKLLETFLLCADLQSAVEEVVDARGASWAACLAAAKWAAALRRRQSSLAVVPTAVVAAAVVVPTAVVAALAEAWAPRGR